MSNIFLTGASGFVGRAVLRQLLVEGFQCTLLVRKDRVEASSYAKTIVVDELYNAENGLKFLADQGVVIHCAARVHVMNDKALDPLSEFRRVNVQGTLALARESALAGIKRFIFISSVKVNGESTELGRAFQEDDTVAPQDPYGISKMEAEVGLKQISHETGMEVVIIRPALVYGPGVKANFRSMISLLYKGFPLPCGSLRNKRSLVALPNLVDLIVTCITHQNAANEVFLVSDGEDLSTTDLLIRVGQALGCPARLIPVPSTVLQVFAILLGRRALAQRLCGSLQVDISKASRLLQWSPPYKVDDILKQTTDAFKKA